MNMKNIIYIRRIKGVLVFFHIFYVTLSFILYRLPLLSLIMGKIYPDICLKRIWKYMQREWTMLTIVAYDTCINFDSVLHLILLNDIKDIIKNN